MFIFEPLATSLHPVEFNLRQVLESRSLPHLLLGFGSLLATCKDDLAALLMSLL